MKNHNIYLIFSKTGTYFSRIIAMFTKKEYSHVSLSLDSTFRNMYSFGRIYPHYAFPGGFVEEDLYSGVFVMNKNSKCLIYKINITDEQYNSLNAYLKNFLQNKRKYKYNLIGVITILMNKARISENKYFCSQFVSESLINSGIFKTDKTPELIKPMDLLAIENKTFVYEGLISEYNFSEKYIVPEYSI